MSSVMPSPPVQSAGSTPAFQGLRICHHGCESSLLLSLGALADVRVTRITPPLPLITTPRTSSPATVLDSIKRVAFKANKLPGVLCSSAFAAQNIHAQGYRIEMRRSNAATHPTKMVERESFRDRPAMNRPRDPMGKLNSTIELETAVTSGSDRPCPQPAAVARCRVDLGPETLSERWVRSRHVWLRKNARRHRGGFAVPLTDAESNQRGSLPQIQIMRTE